MLFNNSTKQRSNNKNISTYNRIGQLSIVGTLVIMIFLLTVSLSMPLGTDLQLTDVKAAVDIDVSEDGRAA